MSTVPAFKRLPRAVREQQMLDAAVKVFSRRGFHAASMDEIAEDAGISKPMVYAYLGTKEELFVACLHREGTRMMQAIAGAAAPDLPADERLWRGLRAFFGFVGAYRDGWAVLYRQARGEQPFAGELAAMRARLVEVVAGMLDHALRAEGREITAVDLEVVAYALVGATESLADWLADHPDADPEKTATRMMNVAWLGAAQLLHGATWRPPVD
ncbi:MULTISPECIES: TetR/AcrR family transcriptional regulator [Micromonospora]|uniref:TetR/AcrR family transcriptional regulator n=1 Tax=Micromonospora zamorensis TaxID=709883 RepID=A0ABZ1PCX5_9ACTN|nr:MULTISPECIES: TetR/AcrR family transcriptional regulator [Micromonospora]MBQ0978562.1 TetR/AcrR family transcriptional regulator [Micromonospora sp. M61]MBQ1036212.1 TetR/AcrR family transcriptional regulator [Micromonospora sp. C81]TQJ26050.1 TetR family transcriptional regulator [Micromonospora sp. A202]WSK45946.1 TetR/AcrR family transcriptional regulator [Micromonospora zamorensis]WTE85381.1 TetR/AcrR family transcriptional regulator [Micromonospora zamorensis]